MARRRKHKWGGKRAAFLALPDVAFEEVIFPIARDLGPVAALVYLVILWRGPNDYDGHPNKGRMLGPRTVSYRYLHDKSGLGTATIARALRALEEHGYIRREMTQGQGIRATATYWIARHPWLPKTDATFKTEASTLSKLKRDATAESDDAFKMKARENDPQTRMDASAATPAAHDGNGQNHAFISKAILDSTMHREAEGERSNPPLRGDRGVPSPQNGGKRGDNDNDAHRRRRVSVEAASKLTDWIGHLVGRAVTPEELVRAAELADAPGDILKWGTDDISRIVDALQMR